jgi:hypothetical protein
VTLERLILRSLGCLYCTTRNSEVEVGSRLLGTEPAAWLQQYAASGCLVLLSQLFLRGLLDRWDSVPKQRSEAILLGTLHLYYFEPGLESYSGRGCRTILLAPCFGEHEQR